MKQTLRKGLLFCAWFLPLFVVFLLLYPHALPPYQQLVVGLSNVVLRAGSTPLEIEITTEGGWRVDTLLAGGARQVLYNMAEGGRHLIFLSLVLLPPLLLATPVSPRHRLRLLAWGLLILLGCHVICVVGLVRTKLCITNAPDSFLCEWLRSCLMLGGQVFAFATWGLLTWRVWFPRADAADDEPAPAVSRNAACPCGSGRKVKHCCGA